MDGVHGVVNIGCLFLALLLRCFCPASALLLPRSGSYLAPTLLLLIPCSCYSLAYDPTALLFLPRSCPALSPLLLLFLPCSCPFQFGSIYQHQHLTLFFLHGGGTPMAINDHRQFHLVLLSCQCTRAVIMCNKTKKEVYSRKRLYTLPKEVVYLS